MTFYVDALYNTVLLCYIYHDNIMRACGENVYGILFRVFFDVFRISVDAAASSTSPRFNKNAACFCVLNKFNLSSSSNCVA